jgi:hypothetical protein
MIGAIAKLLGLSNPVVWLIVGGLALGAVTGAAVYIDHRGYHRAAVEYQGRIDAMKLAAAQADIAEQERQAAANNAAKQREADRLAADQAEADKLKSKIEELQREADQDPDRDRPAIGAPSVRRIGAVR